MLQSTVCACIPTRWDIQYSLNHKLYYMLNNLHLSVSNVSKRAVLYVFRQNWLLETRVEWFISGIWRLTTMNSWFQSQRSPSTQFTLIQMPVTWQQSTARSVPKQCESIAGNLKMQCFYWYKQFDETIELHAICIIFFWCVVYDICSWISLVTCLFKESIAAAWLKCLLGSFCSP